MKTNGAIVICLAVLFAACPNTSAPGTPSPTPPGDGNSPDKTPPNDVTSLATNAEEGQVVVSWKDPGDSDFSKVEGGFFIGGSDCIAKATVSNIDNDLINNTSACVISLTSVSGTSAGAYYPGIGYLPGSKTELS